MRKFRNEKEAVSFFLSAIKESGTDTSKWFVGRAERSEFAKMITHRNIDNVVLVKVEAETSSLAMNIEKMLHERHLDGDDQKWGDDPNIVYIYQKGHTTFP